MTNKEYWRIAIVGATGLVGQKILEILHEKDFPLVNIRLAASERSVGQHISFAGQDFEVQSIESLLAEKPDVALFSAGGDIAKDWAPAFKETGTTVIDNSSAWRLDPHVPLIIPEVNGGLLNNQNKIIANPNCSTIQLALALYPLQSRFGLKRVVVSTYQSVTGSGQKAMDQLNAERNGEEPEKAYPYAIDLNCLPQCDDFQADGYTKEELKVVQESRKILSNDSLPVTATAVRVPVKGGHSESVNVELDQSASLEAIRGTMIATPGITLLDDPGNHSYPMPIDAQGKDDVFVGRIREDHSRENSWHLWIVSDNLRKGAATNAVQILEALIDIDG